MIVANENNNCLHYLFVFSMLIGMYKLVYFIYFCFLDLTILLLTCSTVQNYLTSRN